MTVTADMTPGQVRAGEEVDALDLEPIVYKLMHPEPGGTAMPLAEADQRIAAYRSYLKLCAWYPGQSIVPSKAIDEVWHTHILDTAKYAADSEQVFGFFLHHFPYFGLRGDADAAALHTAYEHTRELTRLHFGVGLPAGKARECSTSCDSGNSQCSGSGCHNAALASSGPVPDAPGDCTDGGLCVPEGTECDKSAADTMSQVRPRPDRDAARACVVDDGQGKCHNGDQSCKNSAAALDQARPRPDRSVTAA